MSGKIHNTSYAAFKQKARQHQVMFRETELGVGYHEYPNVLKAEDAKKGLIFCELYREEIIEELKKPIPKTSAKPSGQMLVNLLRSEHIPYNIFFPMLHDLEGCKDMFNVILGKGQIKKITDIKIEYHPEPIIEYLDDHTAFDVYIQYIDHSDNLCGIGIEVKYTEKEYPLKEGSQEKKRIKDENGQTCLFRNYLEATVRSRYYPTDISYDALISNKFRQIWRNHILGASMVIRGNIKRFTSITVYPQGNCHFSLDAMPKYISMLTTHGKETFIPLTYEYLFDLMQKHFNMPHKDQWIEYLRRRYLFV